MAEISSKYIYNSKQHTASQTEHWTTSRIVQITPPPKRLEQELPATAPAGRTSKLADVSTTPQNGVLADVKPKYGIGQPKILMEFKYRAGMQCLSWIRWSGIPF